MSDAAPVPAPGPRRRRWWIHAALALGTLAALAVLAIAWLLATPGGARLILDRVANVLGEGTKVSGVEGSLSGTLRIGSIEVSRPDLQVRIRDVVIERAPGSPWGGRVVFRRVEAAYVELRTASSGAAARVPVSFPAPYPLRVESGRVGELRIGSIAKAGAASAIPDLVVKDLHIAGEGDERSWKLEKGAAETPWGRVAVAGTLETAAPFTLEASGELAGERGELRYRVAAQLRGTLKRIEAKFDAEERDLRASGTALLEPFEKPLLRAVTLRARDVDVSRYVNAPRTRLGVEATLEPSAGGFAGPVRIVNAEPGPLDHNQVPVVSAEGRLAWKRDGNVDEIALGAARFALAGGGSAQGNASWRPGRIEAQWTLADLDPARWHTRLRATRIKGTMSAVSEGGVQRFEAALSDPRFAVDARATLKDARLEVSALRMKHAGGLVEGRGFLVLAERRDFRFEGRAQHFDPSLFVQNLPGDLNFDFVATGALEPSLSADARFELAQSRLADLPAAGTVRIAGDAKRIANADVRLSLGETRVEARGAFGRAGDAMVVMLHSPNLAAAAKPLGLSIAGKLDAHATLTGTFAAPGARFELAGTDLAFNGGFRATSIGARGEVSAEPQGRVDAVVDARGLTRSAGDAVQAIAERANVVVRGTRSAHELSATASLAKDAELRTAFRGGFDPRAPRLAWRGEIVSLSLTGPSAFNLAAPAPLAAALGRVELGDATLKAAWGEVRFAATRWTPSLLELRGSASNVVLRNAARAFKLPAVPRGNLAVAAAWDVRASDTVDGFISVERTSGDLRVGDPPQPLGLEELKLRLDARRGQAKATALVRGQRVGRLDAEVNGTLRHVRAGFGVAPDAPIDGRIDAQMQSLAWLAAWMGPEARAEGRASARIEVSGTAANPRWKGRVEGENIAFREPQNGFELEKGSVALTVSERSIVVEKLVASTPWHPAEQASRALQGFNRPETGTISATGSIDLATRNGAIVIKATSVPVTQLSTRFLALSGEAKLEARGDGLLATGALRADAGWIGALATPLPSVSDDVVVVRKSAPVEERRARERLRMDIRFSLGDHVWYRGRGLNTKLQGELRIVGEPGTGLRATGSIRTVSGTYEAYGRALAIDHGTLTFFGSLENPALDVLALRKGLPVEAGVEVLGNVSRPRVRLVSLPDVPDPEKISWLVLGRGPSDVSQGEAATLASAANAILGRSLGGDQLAQRFGFDEVRVGRPDTTSALGTLPQSTVAGKTGSSSAADVVSVGKRLSKDLYVLYEQGLAQTEGALRVTWQITQKVQLLVRAGYLPGVDAVYRWTFE